ncbi:MAG: Ni/Fe-hydrogenase, b-type cytochrome subunit [Acidobacteria bacterium]|nr:Ni/Fe-hydrogenase, b-type cytochrome subunit [Acidobacteriota bacterium]
MDAIKAPSYRRIYVWELPVRAFHWINGICILLLGVTGYLIGRPFAVISEQEASFQYWFGTVRFLHFAAGYLFLINMLARIYWGFVGNRYANWKQFIPTRRKWFTEVADVLRVDVLQTRVQGKIHIGHNRLAGFIYFLSFWVYGFQALTGFALYAAMSPSWIGRAAAAVIPGTWNDMGVRQWHHAGLWFFVLFTIIHVYLVFYHDYVEGRGTTSSMVGGWKFEREDYFKS